jgi:hypothetical protein
MYYPNQQPLYQDLSPSGQYYAQRAREYGGLPPQSYQNYQPPYQPVSQPGIICRTVTSVDEVKAFMIEPSTTYFFIDQTNGKVYTKRIDNGVLSFQAYIPDPAQEKPANINDQVALLEKRLAELEIKKGAGDGL